MTIKPSDVKLCSTYKRLAIFDVCVRMGHWVTVAAFTSPTQGSVTIHAKRENGEVSRIGEDEYKGYVKMHLGEK